MISATFLFFIFIFFDHELSSVEGLIMFVLLISFLFYLIFHQKETIEDEVSENENILNFTQISYYLLAGGFSLWLGSETLIKGAVALALDNGVSERIISVSIISIGTSIPELSASIIAVINKEKAISIGNLIGSNIFNLLAVLGITSIIAPVSVVDMGLLDNDIWWMIGISFLILPLVFVFKRNQLSKIEGVILLSIYLSFLYPLIFI